MPFQLRSISGIILLIISVALSISSLPEINSTEAAENKVVPNIVIIKFKEGFAIEGNTIQTTNNTLNDLLARLSVSSLTPLLKNQPLRKVNLHVYDLSHIYYATFSANRSPAEVAAALASSPDIIYAEPKYIYYINTIPNDSLYYRQDVYYDLIKIPQAWDIIKGSDSEVIIAIVDGGTDIDHPDLAANIWSNATEVNGTPGFDDDGNGYTDDYYGWNFANQSGDPSGLASTPFNADHGTFTAGIAAAVSNNHSGVAGTSWNARVMAVNAGSATDDREITDGYEGIIYAAANGADVINCSWGKQGFDNQSQFGRDAVTYAESMGAVVVGAAGNDGNIDPSYPSSFAHVLSVAATDTLDNLWESSNYGPEIDVAAPGVGIFSTLADNRYGAADGTSVAAPLVSGVVGLVKSLHPEWTGLQAAEQVRVTADSLESLAAQIGRGRINAYRALTEKSPSIRFLDYQFTDENNNGKVEVGEHIELKVKIINYLAPASNIKLTLLASSGYVTFVTNEIIVSVLNTLEEKIPSDPFVFDVNGTILNNPLLTFELHIDVGGYQDLDRFTFEHIFQPDIWTKYPRNPVLSGGENGSWDHQILMPSVLYNPDSSRYEMWFSGSYGGYENWRPYRIGFAYSADGIDWTKYPTAVLEPDTGRWDETSIENPVVIRENGYYKMWYSGWSTTFPGGIGYATSPDGVTWTKYAGNPLIGPGSASWERGARAYCAVYPVPGGGYQMWYTGWNSDNSASRIGYATSDDGIIWTTADSVNPVLKTGSSFQWDEGYIVGSSIILINDTYHLSYLGNPLLTDQSQVGWATSPDGIHWKKYNNPKTTSNLYADSDPVIRPDPGEWDGYWVYPGSVIRQGDSLHYYYVGINGPSSWGSLQIGLAKIAVNTLEILDIKSPEPPIIPQLFTLQQNHPNPFNPVTMINYQLTMTSDVELSVYNLLGQKVATLVNNRQHAGYHQVAWDASGFASGIYYYQLKAGGFQKVKKMVLIK